MWCSGSLGFRVRQMGLILAHCATSPGTALPGASVLTPGSWAPSPHFQSCSARSPGAPWVLGGCLVLAPTVPQGDGSSASELSVTDF